GRGGALPASTPLAERSNVVYAGTQVVRGSGRAVVFATGLSAEFGRIAQSLAGVQNEQTPLQKSLGELGSRIGQAAILLCIIFFLLGLWQAKYSWDELLLTSVSLAVAAIPEGLPTVLAITLGLGVQRMAAQKALVRKLQAVETLGCASVICTDKTGTLTANKMTVLRANLWGEEYSFGGGPYDLEAEVKRADGMPIQPAELAHMREALSVGVLCNEAGLLMEAGGTLAGLRGDPTEGALLIAASKAGLDVEGMRNASPKLAELAFDYHRKMMTEVRAQGKFRAAYVKGAPERILERCSKIQTAQGEKPLTPAMRAKLHALIHSYARQALRTLALASREVKGSIKDGRVDSSIEHELTWVGLVGMMDPPRPEVSEALRLCRRAGIRVVMLTGDSPATAEVVARQIGILGEKDGSGAGAMMSGEELDGLDDIALSARLGSLAVLSRATPEHKFRIVRALQKGGEVVAVTGDGVNDAPSIKTADIGVAMGVGGTDVARGAADLVLTDNNFSSLVRAAETGRSIYENIRSFVRFQFTTNVAALSLMFITPLTGFGLPLLPLQILWINIIMDGPPALALGMEPGRPDAMSRPPRAKNAPFVSRNFLAAVGSSGLLMFLFTLMVFAYYAGSADAAMSAKAGTMAFTIFVALQLVNAFNCRSSHLSAWHNLNGNRWLVLAVLVSLALQLAILYTPALQTMFSTVPLGWTDWGFVALAGALMLAKEEGVKRMMPVLAEY
ncbi:MAG: cation-transporting P-type ATPase, partial [Candidatus Marsarchaeota archaeon]|nr:cation-transporting P-type ATPase [Candidatus Marsarchaeota archaeon]